MPLTCISKFLRKPVCGQYACACWCFSAKSAENYKKHLKIYLSVKNLLCKFAGINNIL